MNCPFEDESGLVKPSSLQLALALKVVTSKPGDWTVEEYLTSLRQRLLRRESIPVSDTENGHTKAKSANYWEQRCQLAERRQEQLSKQVVDLEHRIDTLLNLRHDNESPTATKRKRRINSASVISATKQDKALKQGKAAEALASWESEVVITTAETDESPTNQAFLRATYQLCASIHTQDEDTDIYNSFKQAAASTSTTAKALSDIAQHPSRPTKAQLKTELQRIKTYTTNLAYAIKLLFQAYEACESRQLRTDNRSNMTATLLGLFKTLFSHLEILFSSWPGSDLPTSQTTPTTAAATSLTCLLHLFLSCVEASAGKRTTNDILEGVTALLLGRAGRLIASSTFNSNTSKDIATSLQEAASEETDDGKILEELLAQRLRPLVVKALRMYEKRCDGRGGPDLVAFARTQMQSSLVEAMFGRHERMLLGLEEGLKVAVADVTAEKGSVLSTGNMQAASQVDQLVELMWINVGWDVLAQRLDVEMIDE